MERIVRRLPSADSRQYCSFVGLDSGIADASFPARLFDSFEMLIFEGFTHFICDASCPAGAKAADVISLLRRTYPDITLELALPYDIRNVHCSAGLLELFYRADVITMISQTQDMEASRKVKNYLIRQGSLLLAESSVETGSAGPAVEQARLAGRSVTFIPDYSSPSAMVC